MSGTYTYAIGPWRWEPTEFFGRGAHVPPGDSVCMLDYRNRSQQETAGPSEGCGLFAFSGAVPDGLVPLGAGYAPELMITPTARQEMQLRLGLSGPPSGDTLAAAAMSCYSDYGDPNGENFARPIDMGADGSLELWLENHSLVRREVLDYRELLSPSPAGRANRLRELVRIKHDIADAAGKLPESLGETLLRCGYSREEIRSGAKGKKSEWQQLVSTGMRAKHGSKLGPREPKTAFAETWPNNAANIAATPQSQTWSAVSNSFSVASSRARGTGNFAHSFASCNSAVSSADHVVLANLYFSAVLPQPCIAGPLARSSVATLTGYVYAYSSTAVARRLYKWVGGVLTQLSTATWSPSAVDAFLVRAAASTISGSINAANSASVVDTAIVGNLYGGIWIYDDTNDHTKNQFGAWSIDDELNPPVAAFSGTPLSGTAPLSVAFTDTSTKTPTSWLWERSSDGGSNWEPFSTSQNPTAEFTAGTWAVRLTATNAGGSDGETKLAYITVSAAASGQTGRLLLLGLG